MSAASPSDVLVLVALRLAGLLEPDVLADRTGVDRTAVDTIVSSAAESGWARYRDGAFHGWALTATGRRHLHDLLAAELEGTGHSAAIADAYARFRPLNGRLLQLCTDWQLRSVGGEPVINDHTDEDYDAACIESLAALHTEARPLVASFGGWLQRFERYPSRLDGALARLQQGEIDHFTSPAVDSYHTVWFELHEHLLATLGIERSADAGAMTDTAAPTPVGGGVA